MLASPVTGVASGMIIQPCQMREEPVPQVIQKLIAWRRRNGLSQRAAVEVMQARDFPVTLTTLEKWEAGDRQPDLLFLTVSVGIQAQTGGNLAEILSRLSRLMRNRATMRLKIKALSAEGRASAVTLSAFPFVLFFFVNFISPSYYGAIWSNPIVEPAIYLGLLLLFVGNVIMYRMVHFRY